ncbi:MAG: CBS domain-containing protein [Bacteroidota bacterium]
MTVQNLLDLTLEPLRADDAVFDALTEAVEAEVEQFPVVDAEGRLVALVSETQLMEHAGAMTPIGDLPAGAPVSVRPDTHSFEAALQMMRHHLDVLPVVDRDEVLLGVVRRTTLFDTLSRMLSVGDAGTIVVLEMPERDYALGQMIYAVEQNGAKVLSVASEHEPSGIARVTLKLNVSDSSRIRAVLEQRGYRVVATFGEDQRDEELQYRVEQFMRYLDL